MFVPAAPEPVPAEPIARAELPEEPSQMFVPPAPVPVRAEPIVPRRRRLRRAAIAIAFVAAAVAGVVAGSSNVFTRADDRPSFPSDPSQAAASAAATTGVTAPTTPAGTTSPAEGALSPSRTFAWTAVAGANHYRIRFYRNGEVVLAGRAEKPKFVLPRRFEFRPGAYRWTVEPGRGGAYGPRVVDSRFEVAG
jgi:hypothetical protein